ncbi:hypothetical protein J31TS4_40610 [Paenibacillus sp. J31TS4]|nr:hypothetical protein J31TS4_40610 [Paenibacillus sp. J31TS4]
MGVDIHQLTRITALKAALLEIACALDEDELFTRQDAVQRIADVVESMRYMEDECYISTLRRCSM